MQSSPFRIFLWKCFMDRKENLILNQLQSLKDMKVTTTSQRGMTNKSSIMNGFSSRQYYLRKKTLQGILSVVLIIQLLLFHCYFEFDIQSKQSSINFLHAGQLCGAIGCIIILINYYQQRLYQHYTGEQLENMSEVIRKILFFLIMPYEFLNNYTIDFTYADSSSNVVQDVDFSQKVNYLLVIFACFRASYFITTVLIRTRYMSPRSVRISKLFGFTPGIPYCIKSIFKDNPFSFITTIFLISFFMFSFAFRIAENVIYTTTPLGTYGNMAWMTVVTMTTVGYGDYTPRTQLGRIIGALCVTWGVLIVSVMVVVLTRAFSMDKNQSQALNIMRKLQTNTELRQYAGQFLRESLWRFWKNYKLKKTMKNLGKEETKYTLRPIKDTMKERKLMLRFRNFRRLRNVSKITESDADFSNEMIRQFQRAFINLQNLAANNMMIINYLHEEYIFKENEDQQDEHMLVVDQVEEQSQTSMI